jgi:uncharacterized protein YndB with AHSA1/START domain
VAPVIDFHRSYRFEASPEELWAAIERTDRFEGWWSWLSDLTFERGGLVSGGLLRGTVSPPLPYRMRVEVDLVRCERPHAIDAEVRGDLQGPASLRIAAVAGGAQVETTWTLEMMQRAMRLASRVAHPLLRIGHDAVVDVTVSSFRRHLRRAAQGAQPG